MKHFDEMGLLHEKAGYGGWILHGTAGSWLGAVLGGPVRALGRADRGQVEGSDSRAARGSHAHLRRHCGCLPVTFRRCQLSNERCLSQDEKTVVA